MKKRIKKTLSVLALCTLVFAVTGCAKEKEANLYEEYKQLKSKSAEIEVIRSNVDTLLNRPKERNTEIEK